MKFFKKLFGKKVENNKLDFAPLPVPKTKNKISNMSLGKFKIEEQIGELYQAMPNRRAQIWQVVDEAGNEEIIATVAPGAENQKWVESRLSGDGFRVKSWKTLKAEGSLRKLGTRLAVLLFDTIVDDKYIIKKKLVNDDVFEVYKAWDEEHNQFVYFTICLPQKHIKVPTDFVGRTFEVNKKQKRRELLGNSKPVNILNVYDEGFCKPMGIFFPHRFKTAHLFYTINEYCSDVCFSDFVTTWRRHVPLENMFAIFTELTHMLIYLHKNSYVHGNIRPEHIWMGTEGPNQGRLFLNGFSLRKYGQDEESTSYELARNCGDHGTLLYMAPEQIEYENVDSRADQFTTGILMAEFAQGIHPFKSVPQREILRLLQNGVPISSDAQKPKWVLQLIQKCLSINPDQRFDDLQQILTSIKEKWQEMEIDATGDIISTSLFEEEDYILSTSQMGRSSSLEIVDEKEDPLENQTPSKNNSIENNAKNEEQGEIIENEFTEDFQEEDFEEELFEEEISSADKNIESTNKNTEKTETKKKAFSFPRPVPKPKHKTSVDSKPKTSTDRPKVATEKKSRTISDIKKAIHTTKSQIDRPKTNATKPQIDRPKTMIDKPKTNATKSQIDHPKTMIDKPKASSIKSQIDRPKTIVDKPKTNATKPQIDRPKTIANKPKVNIEAQQNASDQNVSIKQAATKQEQFTNEESAMMEIIEKTASFGLSDKITLSNKQPIDPMRMTATDEFAEDNYTEEDSKLFHDLEDEDFEDWVFEESKETENVEDDDDWDILEASGNKSNENKKPK